MARCVAFALVLISCAATLHAAPTTAPAAPAAPALTKDQTAFFESKVRPLLVANCYKCHSVEEKKSKGGLVLDSREGWQKGGENGSVIVPGDPAKSKLLKAVRYEDADLQMPPENQLTADEIAVLDQWIKMGAPDPRTAPAGVGSTLTGLTDVARSHWAFKPVKQPAVPAPSDATWVKTPIDAFILAKLNEKGLKPSPPASKEALIRRATYDLIGLPPTPAEVSAFVADTSTDAFDKLVERLLASPHYGERWGRYWLDTARYSDTTGNEDNKGEYRYPFAWTYRDYVIKAFNDDKPYDLFLKEQIAADLLPVPSGAEGPEKSEDPTRLAALGFITVGKRFQNPNDTIDERIDALTKGTMGLTVSCARCHDHKFDPIPTADYYSLHGVFASTSEPSEKPLIAGIPTGPEYDEFRKELAAREAKSRAIYYEVLKTKSAEFRKKGSAYLFAALIGRKGGDADMMKMRYDLIAKEKLDRDVYQGLNRKIRPNDPVFAPLVAFAQLPAEQFEDKAADVLEKLVEGGRARRGQRVNPLVLKAFADVKPDSLKSLRDVTDVYGELFAGVDVEADAYLEACRTATNKEVRGYDSDLVEVISVPAPIEPAPNLTADRLRELAPQLPINNQGGYQRMQLAAINELMLTHPASPARAMVVEDLPRPRNSPIFIRGEQQNRGDIVPRRFLEILSGPNRTAFSARNSGRLELANAIATKDNPLTSRVAVNRIWMHHFGQAFIRTPDDLGVQSEAPSHPELLDYLASRFASDGWSMKAMHRLIMLSSTYQQSSETNAAGAAADAENRLLWRANLRRLDFEAVRDSMLTFTGTLDRTLGGKPVNLTDEPYSTRRSVYGYIDRGNLPELMAQFDFADPDMANSQRTATVVPQQALFFMNSPMAVDAARKVTARPEFVKAKDDVARVTALYEVLFQRKPRPDEFRLAREFVRAIAADDNTAPTVAAAAKPGKANEPDRETRRQQIRAERMAEAAMNKKGSARAPISNEGKIVDRKPLTVWEQYAQALLFTNEIAYLN
jgi:cytochrome c553